MRTTFNISDATLNNLRDRARRTGKPLNAVVEQTLQLGLAAADAPSRKPVRIKPHRVGIKAAYSGLSAHQLYDQLEVEAYLEKRRA